MKKGLKMGNIRTTIECELLNEKGEVVQRYEQRSRSYVKTFAFIWRAILEVAAGGNIQNAVMEDTGGYERTFWQSSGSNFGNWHSAGAPVNNADYGVTVGTGTTPVTPHDYRLSAKISHGSASGQLLYQGSSTDPVTVDGQKSEFIQRRAWYNESDAQITVKEVGIVLAMIDIANGQRYILILRDILGTPLDVDIGYTLTIRIKTTVTA